MDQRHLSLPNDIELKGLKERTKRTMNNSESERQKREEMERRKGDLLREFGIEDQYSARRKRVRGGEREREREGERERERDSPS